MEQKTVISKIRKHRLHLTKLGVKSLALFGSIARNEATSTSDVDILVEFEGRATFDRFMDIKYYLEEILAVRWTWSCLRLSSHA